MSDTLFYFHCRSGGGVRIDQTCNIVVIFISKSFCVLFWSQAIQTEHWTGIFKKIYLISVICDENTQQAPADIHLMIDVVPNIGKITNIVTAEVFFFIQVEHQTQRYPTIIHFPCGFASTLKAGLIEHFKLHILFKTT